jgi:type II secretory pathway pseudopilin PulG
MKRTNKQSGMGVLLLEVMIVILMLTTLAAMSVPNIAQMQINFQRKNAADMTKRIGQAIQWHASIYNDGFRSPQAVAAARTFPATCENSGLLAGPDALPTFSGYTFTFTGSGQLANPAQGCNFAGYSLYVLKAEPTNPNNKRDFYLDQSGVARYSDTGNAGPASPIWNW